VTCTVPEIQEVQKPVYYDREVLKEEIQEVYIDKVVERVVEVLKEVYVDRPVQRRVEVPACDGNALAWRAPRGGRVAPAQRLGPCWNAVN